MQGPGRLGALRPHLGIIKVVSLEDPRASISETMCGDKQEGEAHVWGGVRWKLELSMGWKIWETHPCTPIIFPATRVSAKDFYLCFKINMRPCGV